MCKVISIANQKGGVGKTSTTQNIGYLLKKKGFKVLCIDFDSQAHLTNAFGYVPEKLERTITDLIDNVTRKIVNTKEDIEKTIIHTDAISLLPSNTELEVLDTVLNGIVDREFILYDLIEPLKNDYDYILIDCNSAANIFTTNALACSDSVIIPCQAQFLSTGGIDLMMNYVDKLHKRINPKLKIDGILITMYQSTTEESKDSESHARNKYGEKVYKTVIPYSIKVPKSQRNGLAIFDMFQDNPVAIAYKKLVEEEII